MQAIVEWLKAGTPVHWQVLAACAYLILEWALPRTNSVKANSLIELVANALSRVPLVSVVAQKMGTPAPIAEPLPLPPPPKAGEQ